MADALVSMVMEELRQALVSKVKKIGEEVNLAVGAKAELEKLSSTFKSIEAVLHHAETMQITNPEVQDWLERLKDVAYEVDDLLDEIPWAEPESGTNDGYDRRMGNQVWACLFSLFSCFGLEDWIKLAHESWTDDDETDDGSFKGKVQTFFNKVASQRDFGLQIKELRAKLNQIAHDKRNFSFIESFPGGSEFDKAESRTSSYVDESMMLGREEDKGIIISRLVGRSSREEGRIHVISIVGIGGLGKTTLAQLIFKDERVRSYFHKVLWVCVSDDFNVMRLIKAIIEAAGEIGPLPSELDSLQKQLTKTLEDKRFLLVLDDVWSDDKARWEKLWLPLQSGAQGSKILVTTRIKNVATRCMDSAYMHELKVLSDADCWSLFSREAFARREMEDCQELVKIGRKIAKKCKGVPLSAKVIGSAMRSKMTARDWQDILESETWEIRDIAEGILPALLLSYYNLAGHLKQCFAYCSVFPKDHMMEKDKLVKMWLAQGFIKPQGKREMEAIGGEYFDDLVSRSLLQDVDLEEEDEVRCKMHDLLHDLAQFITKNECLIFENGKSDLSSVTARHSSFIITKETSHIPAPLCHAKKLRTLILIENSVINTIPDDLFHCARSLRVLDFGVTRFGFLDMLFSNPRGIKELPSSIGLLKHLRYLDLSYSKIVELPESVSRLHKLQTLKLNHCRELQRLPSGMSAMVNLRHLEIEGTPALKYLPEGLGRISSLQTLSRFNVGGNGGCKIGELKRLNSLQGELIIENLERVASKDEAKEAELEKKLHLRILSLEMSPDYVLEMPRDNEVSGGGDLIMSGADYVSGNGEVERMDDIIEALRPPHKNLEKLVVRRCIGSKFPTWIGDSSFSNLVELRLLNCYNCTELPGLGRLPSLKSLEIEGGLIKRVGPEFYGNSCGGGVNRKAFAKLEELQFNSMYEFEEWELRLEEREIMPSLQTLKVYRCRKLKALPQHLPKTLTSLCITGCPEISGMPCLPLLEDFQLESSDQILSRPLPNLPNLKKFDISYLKNITLTPNGWEQFKSLEILVIRDCYQLRSLPDELGHLKLLETLEIHSCPKLRSLPRRLRGLTHLDINNSPVLAERCRGEDWSNISHIPYITIDWNEIERGTEDEKIHQVDKIDTKARPTRHDEKDKQAQNFVIHVGDFVMGQSQPLPKRRTKRKKVAKKIGTRLHTFSTSELNEA